MVGDCQSGHVEGIRLLEQTIQRRGPVKKAVLRMDVQVNKTHDRTLVEDSRKEPCFAQMVKLVDPGAGISSGDPEKQARCLTIPPFSWLSPPTDSIVDPIETLSPDKRRYRGVFFPVHLNWLANKLRHYTNSEGQGILIIIEHMFHSQEVFGRSFRQYCIIVLRRNGMPGQARIYNYWFYLTYNLILNRS